MFLYKLLIIQKLLKAKAHLGYGHEYVSSRGRSLVFGYRNNIAIFDLEKTLICLRRACNLIDFIIQSKGHLLFVNTNPEYNTIIQETATRTNQSFINYKWIGGFLTNWNHMQSVQKHFQDFSASSFDNMNDLSNSFSSSLTYDLIRSVPRFTKMQKCFEGCLSKNKVAERNNQPDCIILFNAKKSSTAILEANLLQIPIISIVDSNIPNHLHKLITYPIPGNGDSLQFVYLICNCFLKTILWSQAINRKALKWKEAF